MVNEKKIWNLLKEVPDPEIPVISIVDLGVVRSVRLTNKLLEIDITPTYSGCPALKMMQDEIEKVLIKEGVKDYKFNTVLDPPWTTDWIDNEAKKKLKKFGIAPPDKKVVCPQCDSKNVAVISEFGSTACKALYKCNNCLEPFDYFKCI